MQRGLSLLIILGLVRVIVIVLALALAPVLASAVANSVNVLDIRCVDSHLPFGTRH